MGGEVKVFGRRTEKGVVGPRMGGKVVGRWMVKAGGGAEAESGEVI